jgi:hypothetical protein
MNYFLKKYSILFFIISLWIIYHAVFFQFNTILTEADSFSYIRMAEGLLALSSDGFGNGWFGFIYSVFLAIFLPFFESDILAGQVANIFLLALSAYLFYTLSTKILSKNWSLFALILFLFHPSFLYYRIHLLAENIYIPIFLWVILGVWTYINILVENKNLEWKNNLLRESNNIKNIYKLPVLLWILLWLLYLTRAEGFIYIWSIGLIAVYLLIKQYFDLKTFAIAGSIFFISFFIFITPYLIHLNTLTGEWGLTNKWAGNWRQAELRGREHMDDLGFEEAVAGLTADNTQLIAGFAWGMPYTKPQIEGWFISSLRDDPLPHLKRIWENQIKLYTHNIPEIYFWRSFTLYRSNDTRFHWVFFRVFLAFLLVPLLLWLFVSYKKYPRFLAVFVAFFIPASLFFTLFFTLNRYFIIFLPFFLICTTLWVVYLQHYLKNIFWKYACIFPLLFLLLFTANTTLSNYNFLSLEREKNEFYSLKQEAWLWIAKNLENPLELKILERFPFVTYYSGAKWRYITPYTEDISDIEAFMRHNNIDYLIIDSMDYYTYRPALRQYLEVMPDWFQLVQEFENHIWQKVRIVGLRK